MVSTGEGTDSSRGIVVAEVDAKWVAEVKALTVAVTVGSKGQGTVAVVVTEEEACTVAQAEAMSRRKHRRSKANKHSSSCRITDLKLYLG